MVMEMNGKLIKYDDNGKTISEENVSFVVCWGEDKGYPICIELPEKKNARIHKYISIPRWKMEREICWDKYDVFVKKYNKGIEKMKKEIDEENKDILDE